MRPATIAERRFEEFRDKLHGLSTQEIFDFIYRNNLWDSPESVSGLGSQLDATTQLRSQLPNMLDLLGVETLLDIPCGDFSWLSAAGLHVNRYIGADIVPEIVSQNSSRYRDSHPSTEFRVLDLTKDPLPEGDALLCRDCLVHLPYALIGDALKNITASRIRYVLFTTFVGSERVNTDIEAGNWRPLNFEKPPFSFPAPEILLIEGCTEEQGAYADKALGVWCVDHLREVVENRNR
ncbi:MAG: class I SAM-dependent methyltransferase [Chlorobiaceae bacterium]|nr:class I SAM-dependent methyltransferase [Chlorobiaceae bacterium]